MKTTFTIELEIVRAIENPANDYEHAVNTWFEYVQARDQIKAALFPIDKTEKGMREQLAGAMATVMQIKEGMNEYELSNGRKLKYTYSVDRAIDAAEIETARQEYAKSAVAGDPSFDELLRIKTELEIKTYRNLSPFAMHAVSRMITATKSTTKLVID